MRPKVLVVCCNMGWLRREVASVLIGLLGDGRCEVRVELLQTKPFVQALHAASWLAIDGGYDYLLNVDADNPPMRNPLDLVFLDLDVVGLPTMIWKGDVYGWNVVERDGDELRMIANGDGLQAVEGVGTGCMLIKTAVLARLFELCQGKPYEAPFMRRWNDRGLVTRGNDFAFCRRAQDAGFGVYAHWDYRCEHVTEVPLGAVIALAHSRGQDHG